MRRVAERNEWGKSATLVCHPDHVWRASRIFEKQGFKVSVLREHLKDIPYDWKSYWKQPWTKSKCLWWSKEFIYSIPLDKIRGYY
ncbi:MAG: hypothetical protein V5A57_03395 [Candidatus Paceibacterota bacterium]